MAVPDLGRYSDRIQSRSETATQSSLATAQEIINITYILKAHSVQLGKEIENRKSSVRCKVENPVLIVKRQFGYAKVVYCGMARNMNRFHIPFASANLVKCFQARRTEAFCMF